MSFYTDVIMKDPRFGSTNVCKDMQMLEPGMRAATLALISDAAVAGHELRVMETMRSSARQTHLYNQGFTQLRTVGVHKFGLAVDLGLFVNGVYQEDGEKYAFLVDFGKKHGLVSGVDWGTPQLKHSFHDWDHLQRVPVCRQHDLFNLSWYPPETYDPFADQKAVIGA